MDKKTAEALEQSIQHWKENVEAESVDSVSHWPRILRPMPNLQLRQTLVGKMRWLPRRTAQRG